MNGLEVLILSSVKTSNCTLHRPRRCHHSIFDDLVMPLRPFNTVDKKVIASGNISTVYFTSLDPTREGESYTCPKFYSSF